MSNEAIEMPEARHVVIVGGGHAGGSAAASLRQNGFAGQITLIGDEPVAPYQRPPLSKAWLKGEANEESLQLRPAQFYSEQEISLRLRTRVQVIHRRERLILLSDGQSISYDRLILATGARARQAPFATTSMPAVMELRSVADAERLKQALRPGIRVAVVGGGYVGLEVAASARTLGANVIVIEREARLLARVACAQLSAFFLRFHTQRGIDFRLGRSVAAVKDAGDQAASVLLDNDELLRADLILVGVGAVPNQELALAAGLPCDDGILVDLSAQTEDPFVYAIGDCSRRPLPLYGRRWRLESVPNALEQAKQAAASICSKRVPAPEIPWFWSDQFDLKLQIAGLPIDVAEVVVRGNSENDRFSAFHVSAERRIQAVEAVNSPAEFMMGRQLIGNRKQVDLDRLRDEACSIKEVAN